MEKVMHLFMQFRLDVVLCALLTTILTGILKLPLKKLAEKSADSKRYTKYVTLFPIILGFGVAVLYTYVEQNSIAFERLFYVRWLSSVSLSLAIYAFWEKFIPSKKKILTEAEISANRATINEIKSLLQSRQDAEILKERNDSNTTDEANQTVSYVPGGTGIPAQDMPVDPITAVNENKKSGQEEENSHPIGKIILRGSQHVEAKKA